MSKRAIILLLQRPTRCLAEIFLPRFGTAITLCPHLFRPTTTRWVTCTRPRAASIQRNLGCTMQRTTGPMRPMPTTTTWLNTAAYFGCRSSMVIVQGKKRSDKGNSRELQISNCRLHHDQQTAHALESAAAAYSNYPMSGELTKYLNLRIKCCATRYKELINNHEPAN